MKNQEIKNAIEKLEYDGIYIPEYIDLDYISENEDIQSIEDLIDEIAQYIQGAELIYFSTAMKFLAEEDASLTNSLELANDMGYSLENLNSETLATILLQNKLWTELHDIL